MGRRPWRRCSSCWGVCHWHDTAWVCRDCGDEWDPEHAPKYRAPGERLVTVLADVYAGHIQHGSEDPMSQSTYRVEVQMTSGDETIVVREMPGTNPLDVMREFTLDGYSDVDTVSVYRYVDGVSVGKVATLDDGVWDYLDAEWTFAQEVTA